MSRVDVAKWTRQLPIISPPAWRKDLSVLLDALQVAYAEIDRLRSTLAAYEIVVEAARVEVSAHAHPITACNLCYTLAALPVLDALRIPPRLPATGTGEET